MDWNPNGSWRKSNISTVSHSVLILPLNPAEQIYSESVHPDYCEHLIVGEFYAVIPNSIISFQHHLPIRPSHIHHRRLETYFDCITILQITKPSSRSNLFVPTLSVKKSFLSAFADEAYCVVGVLFFIFLSISLWNQL